jgi:hypothetical protein
MKNYNFRVKRVSGGSFWVILTILSFILYLPVMAVMFANEAYMDEVVFIGLLGIAAVGAYALVNRLLHTTANINLYDRYVEINKGSKQRVIQFEDIRELNNRNDFSRWNQVDAHKTPTIYFTLSNGETYELRSQHYFIFGSPKEFNAFFNDLNKRLGLFKGNPIDEADTVDAKQALKDIGNAAKDRINIFKG